MPRERGTPDDSFRPMTIVVQDPGFRDSSGQIVTAQVNVPSERLGAGPWGYRVQVVDYDASTGEEMSRRKHLVGIYHFMHTRLR